MWEHMTGAELAAVLELPEGTVRTRLRDARRSLAARMRRLLGGSPLASTEDNLEQWAAGLRDYLEAEGRERP